MLIKSLLFVGSISLTVSLAQSAEVSPWKNYQNMLCQKEFFVLSEAESFASEKFRQHVSSFKVTVYRNFSKEIGTGVEVHLKENAAPIIYQMKDEVVTKKSFDGNCKLTASIDKWPWEFDKILKKKTAEDWSNKELKDQVSSGKKGLIYYWSPKFAYSVYDLPRMEKLAKKFGYEFIALVDPRPGKQEILGSMEKLEKKNKINRNIAKTKFFSRNVSTDLYMRSGFNHFPVVYVYNNNKISERFITGIMTDEGMRSLADTFSSELLGAK